MEIINFGYLEQSYAVNKLCEIEVHQPGYIRCIVKKGGEVTKVEWAQKTIAKMVEMACAS